MARVIVAKGASASLQAIKDALTDQYTDSLTPEQVAELATISKKPDLNAWLSNNDYEIVDEAAHANRGGNSKHITFTNSKSQELTYLIGDISDVIREDFKVIGQVVSAPVFRASSATAGGKSLLITVMLPDGTTEDFNLSAPTALTLASSFGSGAGAEALQAYQAKYAGAQSNPDDPDAVAACERIFKEGSTVIPEDSIVEFDGSQRSTNKCWLMPLEAVSAKTRDEVAQEFGISVASVVEHTVEIVSKTRSPYTPTKGEKVWAVPVHFSTDGFNIAKAAKSGQAAFARAVARADKEYDLTLELKRQRQVIQLQSEAGMTFKGMLDLIKSGVNEDDLEKAANIFGKFTKVAV